MIFRLHQQVRLKSGSPVLTVMNIDGHDITCEWDDEMGRICRAVFGDFCLIGIGRWWKK